MSLRLFAAFCPLLFGAVLLVSLAGCGADEFELNQESCDQECPAGMVAVETCPAFTDCQEVDECGWTLLCAPEDENYDEQPINQSYDCDDGLQCPAGSEEVEVCPAGDLCTRITLCEEEILCREVPNACAEQPLCPGDDRPADEDFVCYDGNATCYNRYHCSGPVTCLICYALPTECPEDTEEVAEEDCDEDLGCEAVDTCEERIYCAPVVCEDPQCPDETERLEECEEDGPCFAIDGCDGPIYCGLPEGDDETCPGVPECPDDYQAVELAECVLDLEACVFVSLCETVLACLPKD